MRNSKFNKHPQKYGYKVWNKSLNQQHLKNLKFNFFPQLGCGNKDWNGDSKLQLEYYFSILRNYGFKFKEKLSSLNIKIKLEKDYE